MNTFDKYIKENKKMNISGGTNLTKTEQMGLKSLRKRVRDGEIIVCQSDKSSRMCVLTRQQYIEPGTAHTKNDKEIGWDHVKIYKIGLTR